MCYSLAIKLDFRVIILTETRIFFFFSSSWLAYSTTNAKVSCSVAKIFSQRVLTFTFAICHRPSVCLSSVCLSAVTFVHFNQVIEIFGNVSTPFGTLAVCWHPGKILRRSSQGLRWGSNAISRKRCKIEAKLVLMTNCKSHMSFRLVSNSMTLDDLERVISPKSVAFGAEYVKVVEYIRQYTFCSEDV